MDDRHDSAHGTVVGQVVALLRDLADRPDATLRTIAGQDSVHQAGQLAEALLGLGPPPATSVWLRCLYVELLVLNGRLRDGCRESAALLADRVPGSVADSARVAGMLVPAMCDPATSGARARSLLDTVDGRIAGNPEAVAAAAAVLSEWLRRDGRLQEAVGWARRTARHVDEVPSALWRMHLRIGAAATLVDVGEPTEGAALLDRVAEELVNTPVPGIAAGAAAVRARMLIHEGRWSLVAGDPRCRAAHRSLDHSERLHSPLLPAQLCVAAMYSGDLANARELLDECRGMLADGVHAESPVYRWAELLVAEAETGPEAALRSIGRLARLPGPPLARLIAEIPGAAAWCTRIAMRCGDKTLARSIVDISDAVRDRNPGLGQLAVTADHVRSLVDDVTPGLVRAATRHRHGWARAGAATDLVGSLGATVAQDVLSDGSPMEAPGSAWGALSDREKEVARFAVQGLTNRQISSRIFRSPHTVNFHLRNVFRKLGIVSRIEITRFIPDGYRSGSRHRVPVAEDGPAAAR